MTVALNAAGKHRSNDLSGDVQLYSEDGMVDQQGHCLLTCGVCMLICRSRRALLSGVSSICEEPGGGMYTWRHGLSGSSVMFIGERSGDAWQEVIVHSRDEDQAPMLVIRG